MRLPDTPSYNAKKEEIIRKYPALGSAITNLENKILENPKSGIKEILLIENRHIKTRRRGMKTNLFSDRLPDHYLYLTVNYGLTAENDVAMLTIYLHDYIV